MDIRASLGTAHHRSRAQVPQRAVTGGPHALLQPPGIRMTLPPKLSAVRSTSQPIKFVDLTDASVEDRKRSFLPLSQNADFVTSPDDVNAPEEELEPPAKRIKREGDEHKPVEGEEGDNTDEVHRIHPGSPLPAPPSFPSITAKLSTLRRNRMGIDPAARKAHGLEPPTAAVRLPPPKKAADFSPWTNNHPEDILNENVVKTGYFDKTQGANQTESNSAKATMCTSLNQKNNPGLQLLGILLSTVLEKRQVNGRCTAPSTFKPPPRVTVTDTKREAWLRDLANPEIPLRKQSRTIPHGIRGKLLMEQCLAKSIPLQRAVWLAKCVGANELRAFRRKGVSGPTAASGEAKWVREWTTHLQQFLEDVITMCGQEDWQRKMNYAVKLSYAFYTEKLLDKDHFLDWIVASVVDTDPPNLPIWLVLAQLYWKDLTLYTRRGRKLAGAILHHLDAMTKENRAADAPLKTRLQQLVLALATTSRACLIIPRRWDEFKHLFTADNADRTHNTAFGSVIRRNENLTRPLHNAQNSRSTLLQLCTELDSIALDYDIANISSRCSTLVPDITQLVRALFDWASTQYRIGISRVYLTARIIAQHHTAGADTDSAILQYFSTVGDFNAATVDHIHRVIVELVYLKAFAVGKYMRWLITSGMIVSGGANKCATSLVAALPTTDLPLHVVNTRKTILKRIGHPVDEAVAVHGIIDQLDNASATHTEQHRLSIGMPPGLGLSAKFDTCREICSWIGLKAKEDRATLDDVCIARTLIEQVQDLHSLATLVHSTLVVDDPAVLATLCDTINLHVESFAAMSELKPLMDSITDRYIACRSSQPLDRTLILALQNLASRFTDRAALIKLLKDDLLICEQQSSAIVCSPASDSLIGMHASTLDSDEDLDAVFASGNTMDEQLMQRVFIRVLQRTSKHATSGSRAMSRVCGWLNQLRSVDGAGTFENLVQSHISSILNDDSDYDFWENGIVHLVSSGCLSLSHVAEMTAGKVQSPETAVRMLPLFLSPEAVRVELHDVEKYRFRVQQDRCQDVNVVQIFSLVRIACRSSTFHEDDAVVRDFVLLAMSRQTVASIRADTDELSRTKMEGLFAAILTGQPLGQKEMSVRDIIDLATPLSISFCTALLQCNKESASYSDKEMSDALLEAFDNHSEVWPQLLEVAGEKVNAKARDWAKDQVPLTTAGSGDETKVTLDSNRLLNLLAVSSRLAPEADDTASVLTVTARVKDLESKFNELNDPGFDLQEQASDLLRQLHMLLQLVKLHLQPPSTDRPSAQEARIPLLAVFCSLITSSHLQLQQALQEELFDLASSLADDFSDSAIATTKSHCSPTVLSDARIRLILGSISDPVAENTLMLASHSQTHVSQQQRLLNRAMAAQQHSPQPSGSRMPLQGQAQHQRVLSHGSPGFARFGGLGGPGGAAGEVKTTPFVVRQWEIFPDSAPIMGENDASLSLRLFGARKVT